jgi:hypothetical protein
VAAKKSPAKKQGKGKAYAPVPKGYKANWNVPKGTPWKKNSPYNPANSPTAKKAAAAQKVAAVKKATAATKAKVKPATKKAAAKKPNYRKPVVGKDGLTDYQRAISYPEKVSIGKRKLQPYDAKWKAEVARKSKRTRLDKIAEAALEFSPLGGITYAAEAVTGKSMRGPLNKPAKKVNRLSSAANAAFYLTPVGAAGKVKKVVKGVRQVRGAGKIIGGQTATTKEKGRAVYDAYVNELVNKEIARIKREAAKGRK